MFLPVPTRLPLRFSIVTWWRLCPSILVASQMVTWIYFDAGRARFLWRTICKGRGKGKAVPAFLSYANTAIYIKNLLCSLGKACGRCHQAPRSEARGVQRPGERQASDRREVGSWSLWWEGRGGGVFLVHWCSHDQHPLGSLLWKLPHFMEAQESLWWRLLHLG